MWQGHYAGAEVYPVDSKTLGDVFTFEKSQEGGRLSSSPRVFSVHLSGVSLMQKYFLIARYFWKTWIFCLFYYIRWHKIKFLFFYISKS